MEKNKPNPIAEVFSYAHDKKLIGLSVFFAVIAVLSGLLPYFAASYLAVSYTHLECWNGLKFSMTSFPQLYKKNTLHRNKENR